MTTIAVGLSIMLAAVRTGDLRIDSESTGELIVRVDGRIAVELGLTCNGPQWQSASQEHAREVIQPSSGEYRGRFRMPEGNKGDLIYHQRMRREEGRIAVDYEVGFEHANEIKLQALRMVLPSKRFGGRRIAFYPSEADVVLPRSAGNHRSEHYGWAAAVQLDADRVLLIRTPRATMLSLMDFRQWGGSDFGLNVRMVGEGKVAAGAKTRRRITLEVVAAKEARRLAARWRSDFDRTRPSVLLDASGRVWMRDRQRDYASAGIEAQGINWAYSAQDEAVGWSKGGTAGQGAGGAEDGGKGEAEGEAKASGRRGWRVITGTIPIRGPGGTSLRFRQRVEDANDLVRLDYEFEFPRESRINAYKVTWSLRADALAGEQVILTEPVPCTTAVSAPTAIRAGPATSQRSLTIPHDSPEKSEIGTFKVYRVTVAPDHPLGFSLAFDRPVELRIEDRRAEDSTAYQLRVILARSPEGTVVKAGTTSRCGMSLRTNRRHQVVLDDGAFAHRTDTNDWVPFTLPWDTTAIDLSFLNDRPAGEHGFLRVRDGRFVFQDGTAVRFWGTCFTAEQNLPPRRDAEVTARRLARYGVNMVRIHQADAGYATNNLFGADRKHNGTRSLDPNMMDRLDYLVAQLRKNGIYIYFDLLSTRTFDKSDGVASAEKLDLGGKPYTNFDEHLIALQEEFARQFLTHVNPHTKLAYMDDPAVAMIALVNENDVFSKVVKIEPYRTRFENRYRAWAAERNIKLPDGKIDLRHKTPDLMRFLVDVQRRYNERMMRFVRSLGVRVPITGSNWTANAGLVASLAPVDFTDSHAYWDHCWDNYTRVRNRMMVRSRRTIFGRLSFQRVPSKPFFCSEWGQPWPNEFRAEMPLAVASVAALQGWGGALIYTYAHRSNPNVDCLSGPFDTLNDPCLFGLFHHAALVFRRPDVSAARDRLAVVIPDEDVYSKKPASPSRCTAYDVAAERSILATSLGTDAAEGWRKLPAKKSILEPTDHSIVSDTGQYRRDWRDGIASIDTPSTQAAWGFLGERGGSIRLSDVELSIRTSFATVAVSSLTSEPIRTSNRLLLTAVSRAENTGMVYDLFHTRKIAAGHGPILVEPVCGSVAIRTTQDNLRIRGLNPKGKTTIELPAKLRDGHLHFEIGPHARSMYYLIERAAGGQRD